MNIRMLALGALFGLAVAVVPACGSTPAKCDANTCATGCCAGDTCVSPGTATQCGTAANVCAACGTGESCEAGLCKAPVAAVDSGTPDSGTPDAGSSTCNASNCAGCCLAGTCRLAAVQGQQTNLACGSGGAACQPCQGAAPICSSTLLANGLDGGSCVSAAQACNASICPDGCCNGSNQCIRYGTQSNSSCGTAGAACGVCGGGTNICSSTVAGKDGGTCSSPTDLCNPTNCASGCCDTASACRPFSRTNAQTGGACGNGGGSCSACAIGTPFCVAADAGNGGQCENVQDAGPDAGPPMGGPCTQDSECLGLAPDGGGICKLETTLARQPGADGGIYPGGYCTYRCDGRPGSTDCSSKGGFCLVLPETAGEEDAICRKNCVPQNPADCRAGYVCRTYTDQSSTPIASVCDLPASTYTGPYDAGSVCTEDSHCSPPLTGRCSPALLVGEPINGTKYCSADCQYSPVRCGEGMACLSYPTAGGGSGSDCVFPCNTANSGQDICPAGYVCGLGSTTICIPRCNTTSNPALFCQLAAAYGAAATTCNTTSGYCAP